MDHFYNDIQGWFNSEKFYDQMIDTLPSNSQIVEIGAWKGRSTSYLVVSCINSGKNVKINVVDTWEGSNEALHQNDSEISKLFEVFTENLKSVENHFVAHKMKSVEASKLFQDESLDLVIIDGSHDYEDVKDDIIHWLPKVKKGGILSGDDMQFSGVKQATEELLKDFKLADNRQNWYYEKN